jgi:predicted ester cyclase
MPPRKIVERYLRDVLGGAELASVGDLVASDELRRRAVRLREAFPDLEVEPVVLLSERDLVAAHVVARGTHTGLYQGVPPTGRGWEARGTAVDRVGEHRIVDAWVTWDNLGLLEQLGAVERVATVSA